MTDVLRWLLEHLALFLAVRFVAAVVVGLLCGRFIRAGKGTQR